MAAPSTPSVADKSLPVRDVTIRVKALPVIARSKDKRFERLLARLAIYRRDGFCCVYCGTDLLRDISTLLDATLDHIRPQAVGGKAAPENLVTCCHSCNMLKSNTKVEDIHEGRKILAERRQGYRSRCEEALAALGVHLGENETRRALPPLEWIDVETMAGEAETLLRKLRRAGERMRPKPPRWWQRLLRKPR